VNDVSTSRVASGIVAALWMWTGAVYHLVFFRAINPAALPFGSVVLIEGVLIAWLGVARPTTIFTFGLMLLSRPPRLSSLIFIPACWAVVAGVAAVRLGMWEDHGLVVAAIVATIVVLMQRSGPRPVTAGRAVAAVTS
jgi:hypothetical protein